MERIPLLSDIFTTLKEVCPYADMTYLEEENVYVKGEGDGQFRICVRNGYISRVRMPYEGGYAEISLNYLDVVLDIPDLPE